MSEFKYTFMHTNNIANAYFETRKTITDFNISNGNFGFLWKFSMYIFKLVNYLFIENILYMKEKSFNSTV
jgi:hypothetical protein